jgi:hypothetical protein
MLKIKKKLLPGAAVGAADSVPPLFLGAADSDLPFIKDADRNRHHPIGITQSPPPNRHYPVSLNYPFTSSAFPGILSSNFAVGSFPLFEKEQSKVIE